MPTRKTGLTIVILILCVGSSVQGQVLEVKPDRSAIVKTEPSGNAEQLQDRLPPGTRVSQIGLAPRYYKIRLADGRTGWSYKGNFVVGDPSPVEPNLQDTLLSRGDVLQIVVIDVEVGDATLIICPEEDGERDVILIDTGEDDSDRIKEELTRSGFSLSGKPITRFIITHYDRDHFGDAEEVIPLTQVTYDHGDNIKQKHKQKYQRMVAQPGVDRRTMTLTYQETFSGAASVECVAVNQATDFDPQVGRVNAFSS